MNQELLQAMNEIANANLELLQALNKTLGTIVEQQTNIVKANEQIKQITGVLSEQEHYHGSPGREYWSESNPVIPNQQI